MIFIDSNVPMYIVGGPHAHKIDAIAILERLVTAKERIVCDAEVLQEILHRYIAINRKEAIEGALEVLLGAVDEVYPIERQDVLRAALIATGKKQLSARDSLHIAIMERYSVKAVFSFDEDFDRWPGLKRISKV